jgi:hypothetical protein
MAEAKGRSSGVGFFIALLVVVPTATWVGMLIPSGVMALVTQARAQLEEWGILENPPIPPAAIKTAQGKGDLTGAAPWSAPPWGESLQGGSHVARSASSPTPGHGSSNSSGFPEARGQKTSPPGNAPPFAWAGQLIQEAITAVGRTTEPAREQGLTPGGQSSPQSGVIPATFHGVEPSTGTAQSPGYRSEKRSTGCSLSPPAWGNRSDQYSLAGWETPIPPTHAEGQAASLGVGTGKNSGEEFLRQGKHPGDSSPATNLPSHTPRLGNPLKPLPSSQTATGLNGTIRTAEAFGRTQGLQNPPEMGMGSTSVEPSGEVFSPGDPQVQALEARLRQLGATYYRLEELEQGPGRYRFVAEFANTTPSGRPRQLEAYADRPLDAIGKVIAAFDSGQ